jgi:hypothetical protein
VLHLDAGDAGSYPGSGTAWTDLSGTGNNGTLTNGPTYSAANGGQIVFDGTNDFAEIAGSASLAFNTGDFTIECWFKLTRTAFSYGQIWDIRWGSTPGSRGYNLRFADAGFGKVYTKSSNILFFQDGDGTEKQLIDSASTQSISAVKTFFNSVYFWNVSNAASIRFQSSISGIYTIVGYTGSVYNNIELRATANNYQLFLKTDGNIGINTNNPSEKLDVNGNIKVSGNMLKMKGITTTVRDGSTAVAGDIIYDTTDNKHQGFDGTNWNNLY